MKKVININFQGTVVPIEESAYDLLRQYIDSLRVYFAEEEGKDEIINDIESRISELFQERLKNGATCITDEDVNAIINNMGRPNDFAEAENAADDSNSKTKGSGSTNQFNWQSYSGRLTRDENNKILGGVCSGIADYLRIDPWIVRILFIISGVGFLAYLILWIFLPSNYSIQTGINKRLYRNPDDRMIAGVCGGIGSYFNVNSWVPRIIFLLPFLSFLFGHGARWIFYPSFTHITLVPSGVLIYIILWIVIPEAKTTSEKLQMKGEKVDLDSIKESVSREMKGVSERMHQMGKNAGQFFKDNGPHMRNEVHQSYRNAGGALGRVITTLVKIFVYIVLGAIAFAILAVVFSLAVVAIGIFPLKDFIVADGWQNALAWLTLIFFIGVPVVGIITFLIRLITRRRSGNNYYRNIGIGLWIFGWICFFALLSFVGRDFKYTSAVQEYSIPLDNPSVNYLQITPIQKPDYRWRSWLTFEPYSTFNITDDTALVPNIRLNIFKSPDSTFSVKYFTVSNGYSKKEADELASKVVYTGYQKDSTFFLSNEITINTHDKFRNQYVEVSIYVPLNHRIKIDNSFLSWGRSQFFVFSKYKPSYDSYSDGYDYQKGVEYIMREDGLNAVNSANSSNLSEKKYKYPSPDKVDSLKNDQEKQIQKMQESIDSAKKANKKALKQLQDSLLKQREDINKKLEDLGRKQVSAIHLPEMPSPGVVSPAFFGSI